MCVRAAVRNTAGNTWNPYINNIGEKKERDILEINNQLCREVRWYIIGAICSSSCWMACCARASVQSTQRASPSWSHLAQLSSKLTLSQTAWEVWRLWWLSSDTTDCGGSEALREKLEQLQSRQPNRRLMKTSCASARSPQVSLVRSERSLI